jgi:hypothetical protein
MDKVKFTATLPPMALFINLKEKLSTLYWEKAKTGKPKSKLMKFTR